MGYRRSDPYISILLRSVGCLDHLCHLLARAQERGNYGANKGMSA